jgi:1,4-alpha-glucan branching enzyme
MTFGLVYAFNENFVLPLSHDEVVHGKHSILGRMPGDRWQKLANLRAYYGAMFAHPGKKLLFMGNEIAQEREWNHDQSLDWHLLNDAGHQGIQALLRDLNRLYVNTPALHEIDFDDRGFEWIDWNDRDSSVLSWLRRDSHGHFVVCVTNLTPLVRDGFKVGVPESGVYRTLLNTDDQQYGGSGAGSRSVTSTSNGQHGRPFSLELTLPPLATIFLEKE